MSEPIPMIQSRLDGIASEIAATRTRALSNASIDGKGTVRVSADSPELMHIADLEKISTRLAAIKAEIAGIFNAAGVESREQLGTLRNQAEADIAGAPLESWKHFRMFHELPPVNGGFSDLLPSDLAKVEPYQAIEREQRARMERAKADLEKINPVMSKLSALISEANSL